MSDRAADRPDDGRRRRRSSRGGQDTVAPPAVPEEEQEADLSRTLFSFLEPVLDAIESFGAPIVIAGVVGLVSRYLNGRLRRLHAALWHRHHHHWRGPHRTGGVDFVKLGAGRFFGRTGRYGVNTAIMLVAFTGILVVANFISFENHSRMDVTATNRFSLAERTKQLLKELPEPVLATAFYKDNVGGDNQSRGVEQRIARKDTVKEMLEKFADRSSKFSFRMVDPDLKPVDVNKYFGTLETGFFEESVVVEGQVTKHFDVVGPTDVDYTRARAGPGDQYPDGHRAGGKRRSISLPAMASGPSPIRRATVTPRSDGDWSWKTTMYASFHGTPSDGNVRLPAEAGLRSCATGEGAPAGSRSSGGGQAQRRAAQSPRPGSGPLP